VVYSVNSILKLSDPLITMQSNCFSACLQSLLW